MARTSVFKCGRPKSTIRENGSCGVGVATQGGAATAGQGAVFVRVRVGFGCRAFFGTWLIWRTTCQTA